MDVFERERLLHLQLDARAGENDPAEVELVIAARLRDDDAVRPRVLHREPQPGHRERGVRAGPALRREDQVGAVVGAVDAAPVPAFEAGIQSGQVLG